MPRKIVLSLATRTRNMVQPWLDAGYECVIVDIQHPEGITRDGLLTMIGGRMGDLRTFLPPRRDYAACFAFPPCTNLAVSGSKWFQGKGLLGLAEGIELVEASQRICEWTEAPYLIENPVGVLSSYWRKPDYIFQPWNFGDLESKRTCLWTGGGFVMPPYINLVKPADVKESCWKMGPSEDRGNLRSVTPPGFAEAVFRSNHPQMCEDAA